MFKSLKDWYIAHRAEKANQVKEDLEWEDIKAARAVIVPEELLQKFIDVNPEFMQDRLQPLYFPNGQLWYNITYTGNKKYLLKDEIKRFIYGNLKLGVPYDRIIEQLSDPNFKIEEHK